LALFKPYLDLETGNKAKRLGLKKEEFLSKTNNTSNYKGYQC